jgi:hypothetical protein
MQRDASGHLQEVGVGSFQRIRSLEAAQNIAEALGVKYPTPNREIL